MSEIRHFLIAIFETWLFFTPFNRFIVSVRLCNVAKQRKWMIPFIHEYVKTVLVHFIHWFRYHIVAWLGYDYIFCGKNFIIRTSDSRYICIQTYHKSFKIFSRLHSIWHIWHILQTKILHWELVNAVLCDQERKLLIGKEIRSGAALRWHVYYAISKDLKINFIATKLYFSNIG